jgi:WD40 repeat protein
VPVGYRSDWNCRWMARLDGKRITLARAHPFETMLNIEQENEVPSLAFSMDGRWMAIANEGAWVRLWRLAESGISPDPLILRGHLNSVHSLCFTPDSSRLATLCSNREAAKLWDPVTGHELLTLSGDAAMLYYARFSADGTTLLASRPGQGNPWDAWHAPSLEAVAEAEKSTRW